jgi:ABC-type transport system involved in multi-copper enzyme maturation permease subunit
MSTATHVETIDTARPGVPLARIVKVELRKMFDTRSGFWLMASIGIIAALATLSVILFVPDEGITYASFGAAVGFPMAVLLPIMAILAVTGEWSQRTGLITFTLVPHRGQVIWAKVIAAVGVGVVSMLLAFAIGAVGNVVGSALNGVDATWDMTFAVFLQIILANILGLLVGFMLGVLIRSTPGAIVAYFVYSLVLPSIFGLLAAFQEWFEDIRLWIDFNYAQTPLFEGDMTGEQWAQLGVSGVIWLVIPMAIGVWAVLRSEVK